VNAGNADTLPPSAAFNYTRDVVDRLASERPSDEALRALSGTGGRRSYTFENVRREAARVSGGLARAGVRKGDVVMTLLGARPEWVFTMLGAWRLGAIALPCSEQLRRKEMAFRAKAAMPRVIVSAGRDMEELDAALSLLEAQFTCIDVDSTPERLFSDEEAPAADTSASDPALLIFTSGTTGEPRGAVHLQRYLGGQSVQAEHWLGATSGDLVWCTAASGWSKSARNSFVAPWSRGAACLLDDARFDPDRRIEIVLEEQVNVLCQTPTEYRMIAKRASLDGLEAPALKRLVSAGEPLNPEITSTFQTALGLSIHDGYGQTETGQLTGVRPGDPVRPGSMGRPLPGFWLEVLDEQDRPAEEGELCLIPATIPTFFHGYLGEEPFGGGRWRTGDRVRRDEDGYLWFEGRLDDVILSAGYRIGPFEVESALVAHPAVAEAAAVAAPDDERGAVVRAVVVLRDGRPGDERLARELQEHVKRTTAPYKYPRVVEFRESLPKTASGKIKRAELRSEAGAAAGAARRAGLSGPPPGRP
jgi:acetyl-CoA synthetase